MLSVDGVVHLSASDLVGHLNCPYLTKLDLAVARGELDKPSRWDPVLELLAERGALHEQSYLDHLELTGLSITRVNGIGVDANAVQETLDAMRTGAPIIAQGALQSGQWGGRADVLRRVEKPSELGAWSYEVIDTKLARETKGNTVLQICLYSALIVGQSRLANCVLGRGTLKIQRLQCTARINQDRVSIINLSRPTSKLFVVGPGLCG
jgi:predicted RecB family nuclease